MTDTDLLTRYTATETSLWVADRHGKDRWGERRGFPSLAAAVEEIDRLPADKVVLDLVVHELGYDRTVTAEELDALLGISERRKTRR